MTQNPNTTNNPAPEKLPYYVQLCQKKGLNPDCFKVTSNATQMADHAAWAFKNIFSVPYPGQAAYHQIARYFHGIEHVSRVASKYEQEHALFKTPDTRPKLRLYPCQDLQKWKAIAKSLVQGTPCKTVPAHQAQPRLKHEVEVFSETQHLITIGKEPSNRIQV